MGFFKGFIPKRIKNRTVVAVLDLLRNTGRRFRLGWRYTRKRALIRTVSLPSQGYLENQNDYSDISYGRSDMAYAGCEIIAVFNALKAMDIPEDLEDLIACFEKDGMVLAGKFGTAPNAIRDYFLNRGYRVEATLEEEAFDRTASDADVSIIMFYNDRHNIFGKIHTVCVTRNEKGYTAHNVYGNGSVAGPFASVSDLMASVNGGKAKGIVLFAISHP